MKDNKNITRREALRRIFATAGMMVISPSLMSFYNHLTTPQGGGSSPARVPDTFFINRIREALTSTSKLPLSAKGTGKRSYGVYSLLYAKKPLLKGSITLELAGDTLNVSVVRSGPSSTKYSQFTLVEQKVRPDALLSPVSWTYLSRLAKTADGDPYRRPLEGRGEYDGKGLIAFTEGSAARNYHAPLPATINWNLLLSIEGIAKGSLPLELGMIDEYDLYAGERKIRPYGTASVEAGGQSVALHSVVMTGHGVLPTFYWLNDAGIPLFVNSGTEVYLLNNGSDSSGSESSTEELTQGDGSGALEE